MGTRLNITRNYRRSHYEIATLGAIGSSMSHIGVWKRLVASGAPMCLVLEDDVVLNEIQLNSIRDMINSAPEGWGVWILGCYLPNLILQPYEGKKWSRVYNFTAAHAYIITREAAKIFLEEAFPIEMHIEYYMTTASIIREVPIVHNEDVHLEFSGRWMRGRGRQSRIPRSTRSLAALHVMHQTIIRSYIADLRVKRRMGCILWVL